MLDFGCNPPHTVRSLLVLISEVMSSFGQLLMPPLCGFFDCGCFPGDLKSWSPVAFKSPRYFSLLWVIFPLVDTIWPHLSSLNCCRSCCPGLLYLDRMFESWSVCGCPGGSSLPQSKQVYRLYILFILYIYFTDFGRLRSSCCLFCFNSLVLLGKVICTCLIFPVYKCFVCLLNSQAPWFPPYITQFYLKSVRAWKAGTFIVLTGLNIFCLQRSVQVK